MTSTHRWLVGTAHSWWTNLERDWQSVTVGAVIVLVTGAFGVQIPW